MKKIIAVITLSLFLFDVCAFGASSAYTTKIPAKIGKVKEKWSPGEPLMPPVILIQDAHTSLEVQKNISKILEYLDEQNQISSIGLEGAVGPVQVDDLRSFSDENIRKKAMERVLNKGELNGGTFYGIAAKEKLPLFGLEDFELYEANYQAYFVVHEAREAIAEELRTIEKALIDFANETLKKDSLALMEQWQLFQTNKINFLEYFKFLIQKAQVHSFENKKHVQFMLLEEALSFLQRADVEKIKPETSELAKLITVTLDPIEENFVAIKNRALAEKIDLNPYPNFRNQTTYLEKINQMDWSKFYEEASKVHYEVLRTIETETRATKLVNTFETFELFRKVTELRAMRSESDAFFENDKEKSVLESIAFLEKNGFQGSSKSFDLNLEILLGAVRSFYRTAKKRDQEFIKNALVIQEETKGSPALVTGGFHTDGMTDLFRRQNVPYMVITPKMVNQTESLPFHDLMLGRISNLEAYLAKLNSPSLLNLIDSLNTTRAEITHVFRQESFRTQLYTLLTLEGLKLPESKARPVLDKFLKNLLLGDIQRELTEVRRIQTPATRLKALHKLLVKAFELSEEEYVRQYQKINRSELRDLIINEHITPGTRGGTLLTSIFSPDVLGSLDAIVRHIRFAEAEEEFSLLDEYNAAGLLRFDGTFLFDPLLKNDPIQLGRKLVHEEVEAFMQIWSQGPDSKSYAAARDVFYARYYERVAPFYRSSLKGVEESSVRDFEFNDIVAQYMEILFVSKTAKGRTRLTPREGEFFKEANSVLKGYVIRSDHPLFSDKSRRKAIQKAIADGFQFVEVAAEHDEIIHSSIAERVQKISKVTDAIVRNPEGNSGAFPRSNKKKLKKLIEAAGTDKDEYNRDAAIQAWIFILDAETKIDFSRGEWGDALMKMAVERTVVDGEELVRGRALELIGKLVSANPKLLTTPIIDTVIARFDNDHKESAVYAFQRIRDGVKKDPEAKRHFTEDHYQKMYAKIEANTARRMRSYMGRLIYGLTYLVEIDPDRFAKEDVAPIIVQGLNHVEDSLYWVRAAEVFKILEEVIFSPENQVEPTRFFKIETGKALKDFITKVGSDEWDHMASLLSMLVPFVRLYPELVDKDFILFLLERLSEKHRRLRNGHLEEALRLFREVKGLIESGKIEDPAALFSPDAFKLALQVKEHVVPEEDESVRDVLPEGFDPEILGDVQRLFDFLVRRGHIKRKAILNLDTHTFLMEEGRNRRSWTAFFAKHANENGIDLNEIFTEGSVRYFVDRWFFGTPIPQHDELLASRGYDFLYIYFGANAKKGFTLENMNLLLDKLRDEKNPDAYPYFYKALTLFLMAHPDLKHKLGAHTELLRDFDAMHWQRVVLDDLAAPRFFPGRTLDKGVPERKIDSISNIHVANGKVVRGVPRRPAREAGIPPARLLSENERRLFDEALSLYATYQKENEELFPTVEGNFHFYKGGTHIARRLKDGDYEFFRRVFEKSTGESDADIITRIVYVLRHEADEGRLADHDAILPRDFEVIRFFESKDINVFQLFSERPGFEFYLKHAVDVQNVELRGLVYGSPTNQQEVLEGNRPRSKRPAVVVIKDTQLLNHEFDLTGELIYHLIGANKTGNRLVVHLTEHPAEGVNAFLESKRFPLARLAPYIYFFGGESTEVLDRILGGERPDLRVRNANQVTVLVDSNQEAEAISHEVNKLLYDPAVPELITIAFSLARKGWENYFSRFATLTKNGLVYSVADAISASIKEALENRRITTAA